MEHILKLTAQLSVNHPEATLPIGDPNRLRAECPCGWGRLGAYSDELTEAFEIHAKCTVLHLLEQYGAEPIEHSAPVTAERVHLAPKAFEALESVLRYADQLEAEAKGTAFQLAMESIAWEIRNHAQGYLAPPVAPER